MQTNHTFLFIVRGETRCFQPEVPEPKVWQGLGKIFHKTAVCPKEGLAVPHATLTSCSSGRVQAPSKYVQLRQLGQVQQQQLDSLGGEGGSLSIGGLI